MADGGGAAATAAAVLAQTAVLVAEFALRFGASIALIAVGLDLAEKAKEEFEEATDNLVDLNTIREQMACEIHNRNLSVTIPFQRSAMQTALGIRVPTTDYNGLCSFFHNLGIRQLVAGKEASGQYSEMFNVVPSAARREFDYFTGLSIADSSYARARNQERRTELLREAKVSAVQGTHAGTFNTPTGVFGLIENAAGIYGYIQGQSAGSFAGAASLVSYGGTQLAQSIGGA